MMADKDLFYQPIYQGVSGLENGWHSVKQSRIGGDRTG
jgi:hypothetical protein